MRNATTVEISREKILYSLARMHYMQWVDSLPVNHQQNLKDSYIRNASVTFNAFQQAFNLAYQRGLSDKI